MRDEASFLKALEASPCDEALRLAFADWLEERGDARAPWVRDRDIFRWMGPKAESPVPALLKALTINAAKIFGADRIIGSIEPGKLANLIVVSGDPLEIRSRIKNVVIAGQDVLPLGSKHIELFKRYMSRQ